MDQPEAKALLAAHMGELKSRPYPELVELIGDLGARQITGRSGAAYPIELDVMWDDNLDGDLRVIGSIDDSGLWSAFPPLSQDFIMTREGTLINSDS